MQKAADHFKVDYKTILRHLDTNKATIKNNKLVLLFSKNLTLEEIKNIKVKSIENETIKLWVYKEINSKFILINNNEPTFNSKYIASKELKISHKTISNYLDTNKSYKDLFFYSQKL
uniref:GIY-YIG endonuclease n=1 Tax=Ganoderma tsugae TaxID=2075311 RepID=A0A2S1WBF9_GANTS|nr:GIY-YIG endonuclease [Ganoderma tsugae]AWJ63889.1 GIY-YIG endonuclease [Ganoderma tsugae]